MHIHELLTMGGYGMYVWSAYAITLSVLGMMWVTALREYRLVNKEIQHYLQRQTHES